MRILLKRELFSLKNNSQIRVNKNNIISGIKKIFPTFIKNPDLSSGNISCKIFKNQILNELQDFS